MDIGCGRGTTTRTLAEQLRPTRLVGIDLAPALLSDARERARYLGSGPRLRRSEAHLPLLTREASCLPGRERSFRAASALWPDRCP
ncbi:class I SAM-dependent methyltransferase [Streptomyces ehimensis]|uniref:Class I SAM-dependent methyltransferase n=1 Tax=Streptomyces ehimensis TaxID=68195 RepID=A0ABV9BWD5_9ACTN